MCWKELIRRKDKSPVITTRLADVYPPLPVMSLTSGDMEQIMLPDVARALGLALQTMAEAGADTRHLAAYYQTEADGGMISALELRGLPLDIAVNILHVLDKENISSFMQIEADSGIATLGLPHAVMSYRKVDLIDGTARDADAGLQDQIQIFR